VHRISFSHSVISLIQNKVGPGYTISKAKLRIGKRLAKGEDSSTGLYAIISSRNLNPLRVAIDKDVANLLVADGTHRYLAEAYIEE
jgi:hypothetical protein